MPPIQLFDAAPSICIYMLFDESTRQALIIEPVNTKIEHDLKLLDDHSMALV